MRQRNGRIHIDSREVYHREMFIKCMIPGCKKDSTHKVKGRNKRPILLCDDHFPKIFKLPANRHPKKVKEKVEQQTMPYPGYQHWALRQHMDLPYRFSGERIACHSAKIGAWKWYWSLYWRDGGDANPIDHVLSVTRAIDKKHAVHMIQTLEGTDGLVEVVKFMLHAHGTVAPIDDAELLALTMEATRFIEECFPGKVPSAYRLACIEKLERWKKTRAAVAPLSEVEALEVPAEA